MSELTNESEQPAEPSRKFDDIASLFGSIVPPPDRPFRPFKPLVVPQHGPRALPDTPRPGTPPLDTPEPLPERAPEPEAGAMVPLEDFVPDRVPPPRLERPVAAATRPQEIPWPDAFEPRPNYRQPERKNWSWLLLIPVGLVAAVGITLIDTRSLKGWIDTNLLHRTLIATSPDDAPRSVPLGFGSMTGTTVPEPPYLTPALPTSPVPVPPGTEVSPAPVDPTTAVAPPPVHVTIQYRRGVPGADGEARRLAALLQNTGGSVELHPNATTVRAPTILFYNAVDRSSAAALALVLANEVATWTVRQGTVPAGAARMPPGSIDIWMP